MRSGKDNPGIEEPCVRGSVVTGLTDENLRRLDIFEGDQYHRVRVQVEAIDEPIESNMVADPTSEFSTRPGEDSQPLKNHDASAQGPEDHKFPVPALSSLVTSQESPTVSSQGHSREFNPGVMYAETYVWCSVPHELEDREWDFERFKRDKMRFWMGEAEWTAPQSDSGDEDEKDEQEVFVDEGFADVDRYVADRKRQQVQERDMNSLKRDPMGGRGVDGAIWQELMAEAQRERVSS